MVAAAPTTPTTQQSPPPVALAPTPPDVAPPATQPAAVASPDTTQPGIPAEPSAAAKFDAAESAFADASRQPLVSQPLDTLIASYTALQQDPTLSPAMKQNVALRLATLQARSDARTQFLAEKKAQDDAKAKQVAMQAERDELQERIKKNAVTFYAAVGTLRASSLQTGPGVLYRLTDPQSGRTVVYIRTSDAAYGGLIGQFIGVKGTVQTDAAMNLKYVEPTGEDTVDPSKVGTTVSATLAPPSLSTAAKTDVGNMSNP